MNVPLTKEMEDYVADQVRSGRYENARDVVEDALRKKIAEDEGEHLLQRIARSEAQIDRGEYVVADEAYFEAKRQRIRDRYINSGQ